MGEIWFGIPYVLETIWLLSGYQLAMRPSFAYDLLLIWLVSQAGRQTGSLVLYFSAVLGLAPLKVFFNRFIEAKLPKRQLVPSFVKKLLTKPSPYSVAVCRLCGLRLPIAITMSANRKLPQLALGVLMASILWDGSYILIGRIVGPSLENKPQFMLLYALVGLTLLYLITTGVRYILRKRQMRNNIAE
jgi:membrane protein DedA with SNARE-associated domain